MSHISLLTLGLRLVSVILGGTIFFKLVEAWSWVDAYYFTVVTISTVGYGDVTPVTDLGKIGATILIFAGLGVFALTLQQVAAEKLAERERHPGVLTRILQRLNRAHHSRHDHAHHGDRHGAHKDDKS